MSERRSNKQKFLVENPICCFCGGGTSSAEPDHVPGRVFFRDKQWPVSYVFPACVACNRATRRDEQAVAMLSRMYPDASTEADRAAMIKLLAEVHRNHLGLYEEMKPSIRQLRDAKSKYGISPPLGESITTLPVLSVAGPLVNTAVEQFSRKLFCALFYKHTSQTLRPTGGIVMRWYTNIQINADEINRAIASITPYAPNLERNANPLNDQFFYRWGVTDTKSMGAFLAFFRESFAILGVVAQEPELLPPRKNGMLLRPFSHAPIAQRHLSPRSAHS